jgi:hypothetical protein
MTISEIRQEKFITQSDKVIATVGVPKGTFKSFKLGSCPAAYGKSVIRLQ